MTRTNDIRDLKKGDIYLAYLGNNIGSEQSGNRPVIIIQNDVGNRFSPTTIIASITTANSNLLPTHVYINGCGLNFKSVIMLEQIRTIDKCRLISKLGECSEEKIKEINKAISISFFSTDNFT